MGIETAVECNIELVQLRHNLLAIWVLKLCFDEDVGRQEETQPTRYMGIETSPIFLHEHSLADTTYSLYGY